MPKHLFHAISLVLFCIFLAEMGTGTSAFADPPSLKFQARMLQLDANEGIAAGDIDGDGQTDLVAGRSWFRGSTDHTNPKDWAPRPVRSIEDWNGYVESNGDYLFDINGDGRLDVIAGSFLPTEVYWYENPGAEALRLGKMWPKHLLVDTGNSANEGQLMEDIDGDGRPEWIVNSWKKDVPTVVWRLVEAKQTKLPGSRQPEATRGGKKQKNTPESVAKFELVPHQLGEKANGHGVAVGDISGDGRVDLLVGQGWYEQPADPWAEPWPFHADWELHSSLPMIVADLDADADGDLIFGNGHDFGLQWWENNGPDESGKIHWSEHEIDRSYSQPHSLAWKDLTGDGKPELITGKRYFAHNGRDPGGNEMPCLYYYQWNEKEKEFTRHTIDEGHIGTGLQIVVEDFNGDSKQDIAVAGKSGTYLLIAQ